MELGFVSIELAMEFMVEVVANGARLEMAGYHCGKLESADRGILSYGVISTFSA